MTIKSFDLTQNDYQRLYKMTQLLAQVLHYYADVNNYVRDRDMVCPIMDDCGLRASEGLVEWDSFRNPRKGGYVD